jgi:VIT1/CCC1 family predicted Fe2+/Mn2+ transporter
MSRPDVALETMAREELGLDPSQLGAPWGAAISSFVAFVAGASLPIIPFLFNAGSGSVVASAVVGGLALVVVGGVLAAVSGRNIAWGALRMFLAGGLAATVTFGVGRLIGVSMGL